MGPLPVLCKTFRRVAISIFDNYQAGHTVGLVPWETSFTDHALLEIAKAHPRQVLVHRFDGRGEARSGADWEWWFCSRGGFTGLRLQAKRMDPQRNSFPIRKDVSGLQQAQILIRDAQARGATPYYCLYSDQVPRVVTASVSPGPCPHGPFDPRLWGAALVHAAIVEQRLRTTARPSRLLLQDSWPWHHLVCSAAGSPGADAVARSFLHAAVARVLIEARRGLADEDLSANDKALGKAMLDSSGVSDVPEDVRQAYERRDPRMIEPDNHLAGVVLVLDADVLEEG